MSQAELYYRKRETLLLTRLERLRNNLAQAWNTVRDLEERPTQVINGHELHTARAAQISAANAMATRLEEHVRRLQIALTAVRAELASESENAETH